MSRNMIIAIVAAAVVVIGVVIGIQVSNNSSSGQSLPLSHFTADVPAVNALLKGIPQSGQVLGKPNAKITIDEYIDYKCPICGQASKTVVPPVITRYVRTGLAKIEIRPLAFIGPDSQTGALGGLAAGQQNRMWYYSELDLRNQGLEKEKWLTPAVAAEIAQAAGCNMAAWNDAFKGQEAVNSFFTIQNQAQTDAVSGTPTFVVHGPKGTDSFSGLVPISRFSQAFLTVAGIKA